MNWPGDQARATAQATVPPAATPGGRGGRDRAVRPAGGGAGQLELRNEEKSGSCQRLIVVQKWLALLIGSLSLPNFRC